MQKTEIDKAAEEFNPDSPLSKELSLMASLIDQIGIDNCAATRGAVKIRLAAQIDRLLGAEYAAPKWVSVEDALPESGTRILYFDDDIYTGFYDGISLKSNHFTHWMPLPTQPPKV